MTKFVAYPKINQYREVIKNLQERHYYVGKDSEGKPVYDYTRKLPVLPFHQTIKLHGTNASVVFDKDMNYQVQSRNRLIDINSDNAGFAMFVEGRIDALKSIAKYVMDKPVDEGIDYDRVAIYGEFAGENIQKGVALQQLPKQFYVFEIQLIKDIDKDTVKKISLPYYLDLHSLFDNDKGIYSITQFENKTVHIDLNSPEAIVNDLIEECSRVESNCPVGKFFGVDGVGEGIVLKTIVDGDVFRFKVKGEKHQTSKVQVLTSSIDNIKLESMNAFVDGAVTENRVKQGINYLKEQGLELSHKSTGEFMRWIYKDIMTEEKDIIVKEEYNMKALNSMISRKAKGLFFKELNVGQI